MKTAHLILSALSALGFAFTTSCATTKGFGQDLQKVGSRLENRAEATGGTAPASSTSDVSAY
jgi:predicted small secreted protein